MRIDSHQHFWKYHSADYPWIPAHSPLHRDWLPQDLEALQKPLGLGGSVAVQARQSLEENRWLLALADQHPSIRGVVGWVDLRSPEAAQQMETFARHPKFVGVRHVAQDEPDDWFLTGAAFGAGIGRLAEFGLTYDLLIYPRQLPAAIALVSRHPKQPFVLDHCAKPDIARGLLDPWAEQITELASHPNVLCKVSGLVTEADWKTWSAESLAPYLEVIERVFGPERLLWGSDWPVCLFASPYARWWELMNEWCAGWTDRQKAGFWGENAIRFYGLPDFRQPSNPLDRAPNCPV
jgi:L-fuconolactonase